MHLDLYLQCLHPWAVPGNIILRTSSVKLMLRAVLNPILSIKVKSINATSGSIGPSKESAAPTHQNMSQPKHVIKSLSKRLVERASAKNKEFLTLMDRSPCAYADRLYHRFMVTVTRTKPGGDDNKICQELMKIGELVKDITMFEDRILNAAGIGEDLAAVEHIHEGMQEVERWLKDILCGMLESIDILTKAYQDQTLLYQHVVK
ncbi:hypothetical protein IW261DRAFT_1571639 [Armillaria novae-zelandiae]|uniref:Uncharacterized protein n=1 Tax=Armillaria novae-zelandiae TaxID=153914 RepID=A0AA39U0P7_9AGAR|nr:hypothetical protein IW261DRAFT_1571639 [Armillaria novae-zelandiae]